MNRLRKHRPTCEPSTMPLTANTSNTIAVSRTMQLAVSGVKVSASARGDDSGSGSADLQWRSTDTCQISAPLAAAPRTKVEKYWATRAVVAETLLSAHDRHRRELAEMRRIEEQKREVMCLVVLLGFWLVMKIAPDRDAKSKSSRPSHFTIPILSPFTSVVEHETGVFGTKAVAIFVVIIGIAVYAALKHRLSQWHAR
ncbi:hypothetical protein HD554DRAFT_1707252 [Boletus coccyginus]|nr:hypothetical protein HD554DRAFT_1707252 [Boletus coccyginus]